MITGLVNLHLLWDPRAQGGPSGRVEDVSRLGTGPLNGSRKIGIVRGAQPRCRAAHALAPSVQKNTAACFRSISLKLIFSSSLQNLIAAAAGSGRYWGNTHEFYLDSQNPEYGIGPGGDSDYFEISGNVLSMLSVPDGDAGPYTVDITSTGDYGTDNSRTYEISVTEGANSTSSAAPSDPRDVGEITLSSTESGTIQITWDAPGETPRDYRVSWAKAGENFLPKSDRAGNAFTTSPGHTVTGPR